ncbi:hypothetical protein HMPREF9714_02151 [Myroides odoratimimus CCUG 12901]|uniref:Glycosyl transferase family 1 domain-containing protein n=1 Tax=Myroides odoratimimus CCUG 10230 TaxID=883150 RepID=A0ABN0EAK6_9FLAO|nr:glycosyltransferase family 4 protein [Myroides odoratimimus]EHO08780.1 hypothetical protein HMPREF9714_02151 [Myroides odoratimimus CCUG 12901]EHO10186.1 hypothetical protein HMPREF9712_01291 [Myroides odoratimimus CCUG 10230]
MRILHIANDYSGSKVYKELFTELDELGCVQLVYTAIRSEGLIDKNLILFKTKDSFIKYSNILNNYDRVDFFYKINKIFQNVSSLIENYQVDLIHAHTWFSDGAVAYKLFKKYNIPYTVTIRNTDMNVFYKYMFHLRGIAKNILMSAQKIIFVSDIYKDRFLNTVLFKRNSSFLFHKLTVLYNGIDDFWINNVKERHQYNCSSVFKLLFIGKFDKGKNVLNLIEALKILNKDKVHYTLTLVGGGGSDEKKVLKAVEESNFISYLGAIYDKKELVKQFVSHEVFAMPSRAETFGLVYLEALSQGLPILNTINEGIYGMYCNIGESVRYNDKKGIAIAISKLKKNYENYNFCGKSIVENHSWKLIAMKYFECYKASLLS